MQQLYTIATQFGGGMWLVAANIVLFAALCLWALRYRRSYLRSLMEQANHRDLIENLFEGIYRSHPDGRQLSANKALVSLNGYDTEAEMLAAVSDIGKEWYVDPGRRDEFRAILKRDGHIEDFVSEIHRHKTREKIWITESARLVYDKSGKPLFYEGSVREITETVSRLQAEERLRKLSSQVPGGLFQIVRQEGGVYSVPYVSIGLRNLYGLSDADDPFDYRAYRDKTHPQDRVRLLQSMRLSGERMQAWDMEFRIVAGDGREKWLRVNAAPEKIDGGIIWHGYTNDISVRKKNEMEIEKLAFYDPLTSLPNRRLFLERTAHSLQRCREQSHSGALIFIDLDNFKTLNDTHGHDVGDEYLVQVARRLGNCVRPHDTVARIGGDEFVVIVEETGKERSAATPIAIMTANKILGALREEFELGQFSHRSSASLGVVAFDRDSERPEEILKRADIAMYQAKAAGRNGMALYDHLSMSPESDRFRLLNDFKAALNTDALELHYQPQIDSGGEIVGAEALCRWHHPEHGVLLPEKFVPLTEQFGLIREFGDIVLAKGIEELAKWQANPVMTGLRLAINVNVQSFACAGFVDNLRTLIERHGVDARLLTLELTESLMSKDRKAIVRRMTELKELGVRLSLDDFGAGYSSLAHLKRLPFDELKIDGSFIADIEGGDSDRSLVKSILGTARTLKLSAVAEHVENFRQEAFLRAFGCETFQGYLYSPARPSHEFIAFVERHSARTPAAKPAQVLKSA